MSLWKEKTWIVVCLGLVTLAIVGAAFALLSIQSLARDIARLGLDVSELQRSSGRSAQSAPAAPIVTTVPPPRDSLYEDYVVRNRLMKLLDRDYFTHDVRRGPARTAFVPTNHLYSVKRFSIRNTILDQYKD